MKNIDNMKKNCRLCFYPLSKATTSLREDITILGTNVCISTALSRIFPTLTNLQIQDCDNVCLPENICNICLHHLDISYRFWNQCEKTNNTILSILEEHKVVEKSSLKNSKHSQYNLDSCRYFKNINDDKNKEECSVCDYSGLVNEIVISKVPEDAEDVHDSDPEENIEESRESFFEYLHLQVIHRPFNNHVERSESPKEMTWEEHFKANSKGLRKDDKINFRLEHNYSKEFSKYCCLLCKKPFKAESVLKIHLETYHSSTRYRCTKCGQKCLSHVDLLNHTLSNHPYYQCKICKKNYISELKFEIHIKRNHNSYEPFQCTICSKSYMTKSLLVKHEKLEHYASSVRSVGKRLSCRFCKRRFASKGGLEWHTEVKHGPKMTHQCDICSSRFSNSGTLFKHMKRHMEFKPVVCVLCSKACPSMEHLQEHVKFKHQTHSNFICELCDKTCSSESDLIIHIQSHTGEI